MLINCNTTSYISKGDNFGIGNRRVQTKIKITPSTNSATKNKAPLLIIQGTDFNYTVNIAFKNTFQIQRQMGELVNQ